MSDTRGPLTRARARERARMLGSINEEVPVPVQDLKRTYSKDSNFFSKPPKKHGSIEEH